MDEKEAQKDKLATELLKEAKQRLAELEKLESERHQLAKAHKESENKYKNLFESCTDGIIQVNMETKELASPNPSWCRMFGYDEKEVKCLKIYDIHPKDFHGILEKRYDGQIKNRNNIAIFPCLRRDGSHFYTELSVASNCMQKERDVFVTIFFRDVTVRLEAEKAVKEKDRRQALLLDAFPYPSMLISKDRIVLAANRAAKEAGAEEGKTCWQSFGRIAFLSDEDKQRQEENAERPIDGAQCSFCRKDQAFEEMRPINSPGIKAWDKIWDTYWIPLNKDAYFHYTIDVTALKNMEAALKKKIYDLERFNKLATGRELKMMDLKKEIEFLKEEIKTLRS